jgi:hypothetical protein
MQLYAIIFSTGLAGLLAAPWWGAVIGACILALYLLAEDKRELAVYRGDTVTWELAQTLSSISIATVAAPLAFLAGRISALLAGL